MRVVLAMALFGFCLAAAACGGDDSAGTPTNTFNVPQTPAGVLATSAAQSVCGALNVTNVGQVLGETVVTATPGGVSCSFAGSGNDVVNVTKSGLGTDPTVAKSDFERIKPGNATDVAGLGDEAYYAPGNDSNSMQLLILNGTSALSINVYSARGSDANVASAKQIAQLILGQ